MGKGIYWLSCGLLLVACGGGGVDSVVGTEGSPCYPNGTCNSGLSCYSSVCVDVPCTSGQSQGCSCPGGAVGTQLCGADLTWGACQCPVACGDGVCDPDETHETCPSDCDVQACGDAICPASEICYDTVCWQGVPPCMDPSDPAHIGWPNDSDLEPNGSMEVATVLPCGDDAVFTDPTEYVSRCASRENYTNGYMNLLVCPGGESDFYAIYMMAGETIAFRVLYRYDSMLPRDIDARVVRYDPTAEDYVEVAVGMSTNDNEDLEVSLDAATGNPQGWYYLIISGKTLLDVNYYTVSYTLNPNPN